MKRNLMIVLLVVASALVVNAQSKIEQAVLQLEKDWVEALIKADIAKLETLYADTLIYTHSSGGVDDKTVYLKNLKAGATKYLAINREDVKVNVYGNSAVVTCKATLKLTTNGEERNFAVRMIHVYVKNKPGWQMVAHQTTRLP